MIATPWGSSPSENRCQNAGRSLRRVRSPDAPKMTMAWGSGGFSAMALAPLLRLHGVAAELVAERGDHLGSVGLVLPGGEPQEQRQRGDGGGHVLVHGGEDRPSPLARVLHVPLDAVQAGVLLERVHQQ